MLDDLLEFELSSFLRGPLRPSAVNLRFLRVRHSRNYTERSVAASGRTLALVRGGEFDPPPLIGAGTAGPTFFATAGPTFRICLFYP